jgi:hypothetical protein
LSQVGRKDFFLYNGTFRSQTAQKTTFAKKKGIIQNQ